ncbi:rCG22162 [Rattus norvegicus]|uniref:RCG22162 n=1 Tax=Rattus norvegicus TaxID=10116 RepID=A6INA9_RAT|nr:rCG22162 [Rattus norvegicus]
MQHKSIFIENCSINYITILVTINVLLRILNLSSSTHQIA